MARCGGAAAARAPAPPLPGSRGARGGGCAIGGTLAPSTCQGAAGRRQGRRALAASGGADAGGGGAGGGGGSAGPGVGGDFEAPWAVALKLLSSPMGTVVGGVPIWVGAALAFSESRQFSGGRLMATYTAAVLVMGWLNLSNDAYDAETGVDVEKHESVVTRTGNRGAILWLAYTSLLAGAALFGALAAYLGDMRIPALLGSAVGVGYMYQAPPFRFSYMGLGEPMTVLAFSLSTACFYLVQATVPGAPPAVFTPLVTASALLVGATTAIILLCSHFHQETVDRNAGKKSPIVRLGTERAAGVLVACVIGVYAATMLLITAGVLPLACAAVLPLTFGRARSLINLVNDFHAVPQRIKPLKLLAAKWHSAFGLSFSAGVLWHAFAA